MLITPDEVELNKAGTLTIDQMKKIRRKGVIQLIAGVFFLIILPASIVVANINWGALAFIWLTAGLVFAGIFLWSARTYLRMKPGGHEIQSISGKVSLKNSGSKHVLVKINDRGFLLMKNESASLRDGELFTLYFIDDPRMVVGWTRDQ